MSLNLTPERGRSQEHIITSNQSPHNETDIKVARLLESSNLRDLVISLVYQLLNNHHAPLNEMQYVDRFYPEIIDSLCDLLSKFFQTTEGKKVLSDYMYHYHNQQQHPILCALSTIYEPLFPKLAVQDVEVVTLTTVEQLLIKRADTNFTDIHLPELRKK